MKDENLPLLTYQLGTLDEFFFPFVMNEQMDPFESAHGAHTISKTEHTVLRTERFF